jgi:hypothetical protein
MILVLHAESAAQRSDGEARDVSSREDLVAATDAAELVDHDPVVDRNPSGRCELDVGLEPQPGDDDVGANVRPEPVVTTFAPAAATDSPDKTPTPRRR